ncbi:MAG: DUF3224 domain-containing protein [Gammaproteobacteria bacterium]|nr:DUF3224 domain-containing protein [Gammaproteobacteria bacterium]
MNSEGTFDIKMEPAEDAGHPAGRMLINKTYSGGVVGSGTGQMISKRIPDGPAVYFAIEEFTGSVEGKSGAFTLLHRGYMDADTRSLDITILVGSGSGELDGISGSMHITQEAGGHQYVLDYDLHD